MGVDAQHAALDCFGHSDGAPQIIRPQRTTQAVRRRVRLADHLRLVLERRDANDRTKNLLLPATISLSHLEQNGWLKVKALRVQTPAATRKLGSMFPGIGEKLFDCRTLAGRNQWSKLRLGLGRIADNELLRRRNKPFSERLVNA